MERASTAAYIAYQRAGNPQDEADALAVLGRALSERKLWRPALDSFRLSLDLREVADIRGQYQKLRVEQGFRLVDYSVDSPFPSPPRASSSPRTSPSASISRPSWRWPATTSRR